MREIDASTFHNNANFTMDVQQHTSTAPGAYNNANFTMDVLQPKSTAPGAHNNANFTMDVQQHKSTAPGGQGSQGEFSFLATTATQTAKTIDHSTKQTRMYGTSATDCEKDLNEPSIATLGLFGQIPDDRQAVRRGRK